MDEILRNDIYIKVAELLTTRLMLDRTSVQVESRLIEDLGIDSLDMLDIIFSLEQTFSVKLRDEDFDKLMRGQFSDMDSQKSGVIPNENLHRIMEFVPALKLADVNQEVTIPIIFSHLTVESLMLMVERKLQIK